MQVARLRTGPRGGRHHMHVDAQALAIHAARIANAARAVDGVADGNRMDQPAVGTGVVGLALVEHAA